jgi:zinc transporter ZupT
MSTPPQQTYLARTFDDGRYAWARSPSVRRRAVLAEAALLAALIAAAVAAGSTDEGWPTWFFIAWTLGMVAFIPVHSVLNLGIRGVLDRDARSLDEHQRRLGERSHSAVSTPAAALTFTAVAGAVAVVALTEHVAPALCLGFLLWFTSGLLTYWHLAWTAPEEPADDPEDG